MLDPNLPETATVLGQTTTVARYFADLRLLSTLIQMSWSHAEEVATSIAPVEALAASIEDRTAHVAGPDTTTAQRPSALLQLPADAHAIATLLLVADSILTSVPSTARSLLQPMIAVASGERGWDQQWAQQRSACSPALTQLLAPEITQVKLNAFRRRIAGRPGNIKPTDNIQAGLSYGFGHRHIPQFLETAWFKTRLSPLSPEEVGISPVHLKRTIAIRLVELSERIGPKVAAEHLGCPKSRATSSRVEVLRWLADHPVHQDWYNTALETLVEELNGASHLIDYGRRRRALSSWSLSQRDWNRILDARWLPGFTEGLGGDPALADDISRLAASAFIWARATGGEAVLAPAVVDNQLPRRAMVSRALSLFTYKTKQGKPGFLAFQETLGNFTTRLTIGIDS